MDSHTVFGGPLNLQVPNIICFPVMKTQNITMGPIVGNSVELVQNVLHIIKLSIKKRKQYSNAIQNNYKLQKKSDLQCHNSNHLNVTL